MKKVYLDNAATTALRPEVILEMTRVLTSNFGNPSSTHAFGRTAKNQLELDRKTIANTLKVSASEIIFTSSGTESNNWILRSAVKDLHITRIITTKIEHHAVLNPIQALQKEFGITIDYINLKPDATIDYTHLSELLAQEKKTLVSLMHVNNEIGTVLNLERAAQICKQYGALFHSDAVQSIGKTNIDLQAIPIDFLAASAHKFHGPKGVGFVFVRKNTGLRSLFLGGEQEKGLRAGTEANHQITGMATALQMSLNNLEIEKEYILNLKNYAISQLKLHFPECIILGNNTFYTLVNVVLPLPRNQASLLLFALDIKGIAVSRGSACQSGSQKPSHVLAEILDNNTIEKPNLRLSFSHYNTTTDIDYLIEALKKS